MVDAAEEYLAVLGKKTWRFGEVPGVANAVKISVNYNIILAMQALGETIAWSSGSVSNPPASWSC